MRAGRLLRLVLILQNGRRHTASELAEQLQVSQRTVLRDIEALSAAGVPVYSTRGSAGGFQLLDTFQRTVGVIAPGLSTTRGQLRRVRVRVAPSALQLALVNGKPEGWRPRPNPTPPTRDRSDWVEGSFRFDSYDTAVCELLALGPDVEVLLPIELRATMAAVGRRIARLHRPSQHERGQRLRPSAS